MCYLYGLWFWDRTGTWWLVHERKLQDSIDYSRSQTGVDCSPIAKGGNCFNPYNVVSRAFVAMNLFYKSAGMHKWESYFNGTAVIVQDDPSKHPIVISTGSLLSWVLLPFCLMGPSNLFKPRSGEVKSLTAPYTRIACHVLENCVAWLIRPTPDQVQQFAVDKLPKNFTFVKSDKH